MMREHRLTTGYLVKDNKRAHIQHSLATSVMIVLMTATTTEVKKSDLLDTLAPTTRLRKQIASSATSALKTLLTMGAVVRPQHGYYAVTKWGRERFEMVLSFDRYLERRKDK